MKGLRRTQIIVCWIWLAFTLGLTFLAQMSQPEYWKDFNFWVMIVLIGVAAYASHVMKVRFMDKHHLEDAPQWPLMLGDAKYMKLVNWDVTFSFVVVLVADLVYVRPLKGQEAIFMWILNLSIVLGLLLFLLSYFDKKYGPKDMTPQEARAARLAGRRGAKTGKPQKQKTDTTGEPAVATARSNKKKKKYQGKRK